MGDDGRRSLIVRPFRKRLGKITASFEPAEATLIADLVDQIRQMLAARRHETPVDPLAAVTGMAVGASTAPEDPAVARLFPDFHAGDPELSAGMRMLREPELLAAKDAAAVTLLDSLPRGGGTIRLDDATAQAWMTALNDVRLALGVRLDIKDDEEPDDEGLAPEDPFGAMFVTYRWLTAVQDSLVNAVLE